MRDDRVVQKYLKSWAEPCARWAEPFYGEHFSSAVVVAAFDENAQLLDRLLAHRRGGRADLVLLVVNEVRTVESRQNRQNAELIQMIFERSGAVHQQEDSPLSLHRDMAGIDPSIRVLLIDATRLDHCLRKKEGVGRARKMGADVALALFDAGAIESHFLGSTDADVSLPKNYFSVLESESSCTGSSKGASKSALLFPYEHRIDESTPHAAQMCQLESSFRYYALGLDFAGSPYAYHSLGSALAVSLPYYARGRGFPNREAGEDFYLLSKLSKMAPLYRLRAPTIQIETRVSHRVPFGTGPAFSKAIEDLSHHGVQLQTYDPDSFQMLRDFLQVLTLSSSLLSSELSVGPVQPSAWVLSYAQKFWQKLRPALLSCPSPQHRLLRLHEQFDALSTLQFIHRVHEQVLMKLPIAQALEKAPFIESSFPGMDQLLSLRRSENQLPPLVGPSQLLR